MGILEENVLLGVSVEPSNWLTNPFDASESDQQESVQQQTEVTLDGSVTEEALKAKKKQRVKESCLPPRPSKKRKTKEEVFWIPSLEAAMSEVMELQPVLDAEMRSSLKDNGSSHSRRESFLLQDPPRIAKLLTDKRPGKSVQSAFPDLYRSYEILKGNLIPVEATSEQVKVITEWSMLTLIFGQGSVPSSLSGLLRWLRYIPVHFAMKMKPRPSKTLAESVALMQMAKNKNTQLWEALLSVAEERIRADSEMPPLPRLEAWKLEHKRLQSTSEAIAKSETFPKQELSIDINAMIETLHQHVFKKIPISTERMKDSSGPNLALNWEFSIASLFKERKDLLVYQDRANRNQIRFLGWNYLNGRIMPDFQVCKVERRVLEDWALMGVVLSHGLRLRTGPSEMMLWMRQIRIFKTNDNISDKEWLRLLVECKVTNRDLWNAMRDFSLLRIRRELNLKPAEDVSVEDEIAYLKETVEETAVNVTQADNACEDAFYNDTTWMQ